MSWPSRTAAFNIYPSSDAEIEYREGLAQAGYAHERVGDWSTSKLAIPDGFATVVERRGRGDVHYVGRSDTSLILVEFHRGKSVTARAAAADRAAADAAFASIREAMPKVKAAKGDAIDVGFWYATPNGPRRTERRIEAPAWDAVQPNYAGETQGALGGLMSGFRPSHGGQIILWQGPAGTGKTYALRALCREWRDWCTAEYVVDPDTMFGSDPSYLMRVLLEREEDDDEKWRLLILEDTGELVSPSARTDTGQALSRLLNVADGFLGQGLRVLILITTNEVMEKLHPAVARPGRAASVIRFDALSGRAAEAWRAAHGIATPPTLPGFPERGAKAATIAELYAEVEGFERREVVRPVGFTA